MSDFETWWNSQCTGGYFIHDYPNDKATMQAAYEAGRKAGLEESAEIAVATGSLGNTDAGFDMADRIADTIRRERIK